MKHEISSILRLLVKEKGSAYIPGIGRIYTSYTPASLSPGKQRISPPQSQLMFDGSLTGSDDTLVKYTASCLGISLKDAIDIVSRYTDDILQGLVANGKCTLEHIGNFTYVEDGIHFSPMSNKNGLQSLPLKPVKNVENYQMASNTNFTKYDSSDKRSSSWLLWLILGALVLATVFSYRTCNSTVGVDVHEREPSHVMKASIDSMAEEVDPLHNLNDFGQEIPANGRCVIITGSLSKMKHILKMENMLASKGYTVYKSMHNDLTRVGITFECQEVELEAFVQKIRREVDAKAWYLDPSITVAYN